MNIQLFREVFFKLVCFSSNQVYAWNNNFNKNNLTNWVKKGYLLKLRNSLYSFPEYLENPEFTYFIANRMYRPSYISLQTCMAFYGLIPEAVTQITSISSLKTADFKNNFGYFQYQSVQPNLFFGYEQKPLLKDLSILIASPEKAILDFLYLNPMYNTVDEILELRIDSEIFEEIISIEILKDYAKRFNSIQLNKRIDLLIESI
ncbi:MAG: hypothetical protein AB7S50_01550 [Bacteroidales bacterium]